MYGSEKWKIEPEEILFESLVKRKRDFEDKKLENRFSEKKERNFLIISFLVFFILISKSFYLQVLKTKEYSQKAKANQYLTEKIKAQRGVIYDRNFEILAQNETNFNLVFEREKLPKDKKEREKIFQKVSQFLGIPKDRLEKEIFSKEKFTIKNLDPKIIVPLKASLGEVEGVQIVEEFNRKYLKGKYFSHLLGYLGKIKEKEYQKEKELYTIFDFVGREGVEAFYEEELRAKPGIVKIERDAKGNVIRQEISSFPQSGKSLVLTIDSQLQQKLGESLEEGLRNLGLKRGAGVVLDVKTGEVLAMVSLPSFDNNIFSGEREEEIEKLLKDENAPLFNRVIKGQYLIGSTIKPFLALASLEEGNIKKETKISDEPGEIVIPHAYKPGIFYKFRDWRIHGVVSVREAISQSCNIFFYAVGGGYTNIKGLGPTKIKQWLSLFGFGQKTQIDLPGEAEGLVPDPEWKKKYLKENWWDGDTYLLSIGQQYLKISPLQVAVAYSALGNGGKLLKPRVVKMLVDEERKPIKEFSPEILREISFKKENLEIVLEGMRWAVTGENSPFASAKILYPLPAMAKTGTAENSKGKYTIWVSILFPYYDPKISMVLVAEDSPTLSLIILPIAKNILEWYAQREGIQF